MKTVPLYFSAATEHSLQLFGLTRQVLISNTISSCPVLILATLSRQVP
ncbi:MAG TPA: hypothetical protein PKU95_01040 [Candidatus Dojkabacteria bacterium]|nr:hypothetical protein [Candidatus Dojkabacteria bacterium]